MSTPVTTTTPQGGSISTTPTASRSSSPATPLPSATSSTSSLTNQPASAPTPARLSVQDQAKLLTTDAFDKIIKYICGEIQGTCVPRFPFLPQLLYAYITDSPIYAFIAHSIHFFFPPFLGIYLCMMQEVRRTLNC